MSPMELLAFSTDQCVRQMVCYEKRNTVQYFEFDKKKKPERQSPRYSLLNISHTHTHDKHIVHFGIETVIKPHAAHITTVTIKHFE